MGPRAWGGPGHPAGGRLAPVPLWGGGYTVSLRGAAWTVDRRGPGHLSRPQAPANGRVTACGSRRAAVRAAARVVS